MAMQDVICRLAVSLSLETAAFEKGATLAEKRMGAMQRNFAKVKLCYILPTLPTR